MVKSIGITDISKKYKKGRSYLNTILCRPEFNKFFIAKQKCRGGAKYIFMDIPEFHYTLKNIIDCKYIF